VTSSPLVSVVLPTRDRAESLGRAIESVLSQTYRPLELLVVDDGSVDGTAQVLAGFEGRVTVLHQDGAGPYVARNLALAHARGELVAFMDSDDAWLPHRLASQVPLLARPDVGLVFGDALHVGPAARRARRRRWTCFAATPPRTARFTRHLAWGNCVPTITVLARRSCLEEAGGFPTSHPISADYLMWFRIACRHEVDLVDDVVAEYTVHDGGISRQTRGAVRARLELFGTELEASSDPTTRDLLRRIVFCLGVTMAIATARSRGHRRAGDWGVAGAALRQASVLEGLCWCSSLVARRVAVRARVLW
jgi:glycosyltransferase involved in cell wall biosynthesis